MKRRMSPLVIALSTVLFASMGSGCAIKELKNTNRRLKESNDRLVAENNRLEQELAAAEREVADKAQLVEQLRSGQGAKGTEIARTDPREGGLQDFTMPGVDSRFVPQGILLTIEENVLFASGRASLSRSGQSLLHGVAGKLNQARYQGHLIRVEGHTDDIPVNKVKKQYPTNWELSTARACTVVRYLVDNGRMSPGRIYPAGYSYHKPVSAGRTESARRRNRRVEILILNERV